MIMYSHVHQCTTTGFVPYGFMLLNGIKWRLIKSSDGCKVLKIWALLLALKIVSLLYLNRYMVNKICQLWSIRMMATKFNCISRNNDEYAIYIFTLSPSACLLQGKLLSRATFLPNYIDWTGYLIVKYSLSNGDDHLLVMAAALLFQ